MKALARAVVRYRFLVIAIWAVVAVLAIPRAATVNEVLQVEGTTARDVESIRAQRLIENAFSRPVAKFMAVAIKGPVTVEDERYVELLTQITAVAESEPYIAEVRSVLTASDEALTSPDRRTTFLLATFDLEFVDAAVRYAPVFRDAVHEEIEDIDGVEEFEVYVTGDPALENDTRTISSEDAKRAELRALLPTGIVLVLAFGAILAAILPIIVGVFSISLALAAVTIAAAWHPMSVFVLMIVTMVGLGVGIDYSLLIVTRFREEMNRGLSPKEAAMRAVVTAGEAVVISGLTVLVGFATLLTTPIIETRSVGIGGFFVVTAAVGLSTTLLPAVLAILGRAIDWPKWLASRLAWYHAPSAWERWARWLSYHPWKAVMIGAILVGAITWPLANIKIGLPKTGWFPEGTESNAGAELLNEVGSRWALQPIRITLQAPGEERVVGSRYIRGLRRFSDSIYADQRVERIIGPVNLEPGASIFYYLNIYGNLDRARERYPDFFQSYVSENGNVALMDVFLADTTDFNAAMEVVGDIRGLVNNGVRGLDSVTVNIGGFSAASLDLQEELMAGFPRLIMMVLAITAIMMFIAFKSVLVPIKAVIMNCLSVAGAFGLVVLVFQQGVGAQLLGIPGATGAVYAVVPVLVFAVVFGLSMDYEVFLLSRMREAFVRTHKNDLATMEGLSVTASVITSAALIMIIVFGMFMFSRVFAAKLMGFGLAVAVFLDATLIRMVLVPAFMHIAGRWNWWPGVRELRPVTTDEHQAEAVAAESKVKPVS